MEIQVSIPDSDYNSGQIYFSSVLGSHSLSPFQRQNNYFAIQYGKELIEISDRNTNIVFAYRYTSTIAAMMLLLLFKIYI